MTGYVIRRAGFWLLVSILTLVLLFPFYYALITSFKSGPALFAVDYLSLIHI